MTCWTSWSAFPKLTGSSIPCETAAPGAQPAAWISPLPVHRPAHPTRPLLFLRCGLSSTKPHRAPPRLRRSPALLRIQRSNSGETSPARKVTTLAGGGRRREVRGLRRECRRWSWNFGSSVFSVSGHGPVVWSCGGPKPKPSAHPLPE